MANTSVTTYGDTRAGVDYDDFHRPGHLKTAFRLDTLQPREAGIVFYVNVESTNRLAVAADDARKYGWGFDFRSFLGNDKGRLYFEIRRLSIAIENHEITQAVLGAKARAFDIFGDSERDVLRTISRVTNTSGQLGTVGGVTGVELVRRDLPVYLGASQTKVTGAEEDLVVTVQAKGIAAGAVGANRAFLDLTGVAWREALVA